MQRRIAFFRVGDTPMAWRSVAAQLEARFPEYELEHFDLARVVRGRADRVAANAVATALTYGWDIARGRRRAHDCYLRTRLLYREVERFAARRVRPDEHAFSFQMQSLFDTSVAGVPHFVYTDHTNLNNLDYGPDFAGRVYPARWRALEAAIYRHAERVFVRSGGVRRRLLEDYGQSPERVACVYAGSNAAVEAYPPSPGRYERKRILFVGMDWRRKGGAVLLEAFGRVLRRHPDATLVLVGDVPPLQAPNVSRVGEVPLERVHDYFEGASVFCLPTLLEPFGIVFVEAMAHALPIVATRVGALP